MKGGRVAGAKASKEFHNLGSMSSAVSGRGVNIPGLLWGWRDDMFFSVRTMQSVSLWVHFDASVPWCLDGLDLVCRVGEVSHADEDFSPVVTLDRSSPALSPGLPWALWIGDICGR